MKLYNSLTNKKETFEPLEEGKVTMYVCGPTVYDVGHLGHARSAVAFDVVRRYLTYKGYEVKFVSNFTDIDDKMIARANERGISVKELAEEIIPEYQQDYAELGILPADNSPLATEYVDAIIDSIRMLEEKGCTYVIEGDGVYFMVEKFAEYGKLSNQNLEELNMGARVEVNQGKKHPSDFALWKMAKPGEPSWESPWGEGRPGWHIECSAMVGAIFGGTIDIHGGGVDLKFPHHECEVAQHEAATGEPFVNYWMHNGFIKVDSEKMSKSLGNFSTIKDILGEFEPMVVRLFLLQKNYRAPIDFTAELLGQTKSSFDRIQDFLRKIDGANGGEGDEAIESAVDKFENGMDDDFETPEALAALFEFIRAINSLLADRHLSVAELDAVNEMIAKFDQVLGVAHLVDAGEVSDEVKSLINEREAARAEKDWAKSDEIRDRLKDEFGVIVEDTAEGTVWKKV